MLFITKYENGRSSFGGMVRVKDIESITDDAEFLSVNLRNPFGYTFYMNESGNTVSSIGLFRIDRILSLFKRHTTVYFHTVGNFIKIFPFLFLLRNKKKIIDLHGAQPEEFEYSGERFKSAIFSFFERLAFRKCDVFIHVSLKMLEHFQVKHPRATCSDLYVPIFSNNIDVNIGLDLEEEEHLARTELGFFDDQPVFLYSGGVQAWQKIEQVIAFSKLILDSGGRVIILSMQKELFEAGLRVHQHNSKLLIKSVKPEELSKYYLAATYGMMFRDDHVLNEVASPTKLSEYLFYGVVPVLTSVKVGDFVGLGMEYCELDNFSFTGVDHRFKSKRNREVIIKAILSSQKDKLRTLLNEK